MKILRLAFLVFFLASPAVAETYFLDANYGSDTSGNGSSASPWQTLAKAQAIAVSGDVVLLRNGNYGSYSEKTAPARTNWISYRADTGHHPQLTGISLRYTSTTNAYLRFENLKVLSGKGGNVVFFRHSHYLEFLNNELSSEKFCRENSSNPGKPYCAAGIYVQNSRHVLIQRNKIYHVAVGMSISGSRDFVIQRNFIRPQSGTGIQYAFGNKDFLIDSNHIFGESWPSYPSDPDGPEDPHASIISVRSGDATIRGNIMHGMGSSSGLMFYNETSVPAYSNILVENNLIYDVANSYVFRIYNLGQNVIVRNNLLVGHYRTDSTSCPGSVSDGRYRFNSGFTVHSVGDGFSGSDLKLHNNIIIGIAGLPSGVDERNNIFWSLNSGGWQTNSPSGTSKIVSTAYNGCGNHPTYFEDGSFFSETIDYSRLHYREFAYAFADNSEGINFGDSTLQTAISLGTIGSDGFIEDNGISRSSTVHSAGPFEPTPSCISVTNENELQSALSAVTGGECISLANGDYGSFDINNKNYSAPVTIHSANGRGANFQRLRVDNSSNIHLSHITISPGGRENLYIFNGSHHIEFSNSEIFDVPGFNRNNPVYTDVGVLYGINVNGADEITIRDNYVHDVGVGMLIVNTSNLTISNNIVDYVQDDGFKFAAVHHVLIENNTGPRYRYPAPTAHNDFIQFQGSDSSDIIIRGNVTLPADPISNQGIFFDDAVYTNVLIENNIVYCGNLRGISVSAGSGIIARYNTVLTPPTWGAKGALIILPSGSLSEFNVSGLNANQSGINGTNHTIQYDDPSGSLFYNSYYQNAMAGAGITLEDLRPIANSPAHEQIGAFRRIYELISGGPGGENTPPTAKSQSLNTNLDTPFDITLSATDPDSEALTYFVVTPPVNGTLSGTAPNLTYTPNVGYEGTDSFAFQANDGHADSNVATISISVVSLDTDLIGYWPFSADFQDKSGFNHHGTPLNGAAISQGTLVLDGVDDRVDAGNFSVSGNQITIAAWVRAASYRSDMRIISKALDVHQQNWLLEIDDGPNVFGFRISTSSGLVRLTGGAVTLNQWVHVVGVYDGSQMRLYKNAVLSASQAHSGDLVTGSEKVLIGDNNPGGVRQLHGSLDEVRIYGRALSQQEIQTLFEAGINPIGDKTPPAPPSKLRVQ